MTDEERKQIVSDVLAALKQNSTTIDQMLEKENCADDDFFETNKGNKISFKTLSKGYNEEQGAVGDAVRYQFKRSDGKKLYPQTSSACVTMSDGDDSLDTRVKNITTEYNVSLFHPKQGIDGGNKYTLETAIALVPSKYRTIGLKCLFTGENGQSETWEYKGGGWGVSAFSQVGAGKFTELGNRLNYFFSIPLEYIEENRLNISGYAFLYIQQGDLEKKYVRYTLKKDIYPYPTNILKALVVSLKSQESGELVISELSLGSVTNDMFVVGYTTSTGEFKILGNSDKDIKKIYSEIEKIKESVGNNTKEIAELDSLAKSTQQTAANAREEAANAREEAANAREEVNAISMLFSESRIQISEGVLKKNVPAYLKNDGTLITEGLSANYTVVSDFIEIKGVVKNIKACFNKLGQNSSCVGLAFYSSNSEDSFISSVNEFTEELASNWVKFDGDIITPNGAKYMRIAGNTVLFNESPSIEMYEKISKEDAVYSDAPDNGYEYFSYDVDTAKEDIEDTEKSTSIVFPAEVSKDNGYIKLPASYTRNGIPTRLVIINHGAGGQVTDSSSGNGDTTYASLLHKNGFAILCINGVPENMRNTKYMNAAQNGAAAHMGGWVYIRSALAAYKYVTEKYNIAKDGCFIIGRSMGGLASLNLAMSGVIPVKAMALDAPVIDSFHDAYFSGDWSGGTLGGKTPAIFAWIFQWDYCNFDDDTYTIPIGEYNIFGQTYNVETEETKSLATLKDSQQDMAILWHLNENKMYGYNAYKTGDFLIKNLDDSHVYNLSTDNDDAYYGKKLPCPCKIWFGSGDTVNQIDIAKRFIKKIRNGGSIAILRTCPTNRHTIWNETETVPDGVDISVVEDGITCSPYAVELWNWIKRWDS